jgi:hypothetical protein
VVSFNKKRITMRNGFFKEILPEPPTNSDLMCVRWWVPKQMLNEKEG